MKRMIITNASQILTMEGAGWEPLSGEAQDHLSIRKGKSIVVEDGKIKGFIDDSKVTDTNGTRIVNARGGVVMPGFVDSHTHIVYGGSRFEEFYLKLKGKGYLEILNSGNGIYRTVNDTRNASEDEIFRQSIGRIYDAVSTGTTTMEIKTGYGLDTKEEMKMLHVIERISSIGLVSVVPTFLPLHAIPRGLRETDYLEEVTERMIPLFRNRARFIDSFCDRGAFSPESTEKFFRKGQEAGFQIKMHADELGDIGCLDLLDRFRMVSVDHLLETGDQGIARILKSGAMANFLPITAFNIRDGKYPDIRKFQRSGVPFALASDCSPISCNSSMIFAIYLAVRYCNISIEAALNAATINGAFSAGESMNKGSLDLGKDADLIILDAADYREIPYRYGSRLVRSVIRGGEIIYDNGSIVL